MVERYDMIKIGEYKLEFEKIFDKDKYSKVKVFRLYVIDMKDGNINLSFLGLNVNMVYEREVDYNNISNFI